MRINCRILLYAGAVLQATDLAVGASLTCISESQPNPIINQYPNDITGTINGTTAIIPIPYATARKIIPAQYGILTHAYQSLMPNLPPGTFPAVLEAVLDHDIHQGNILSIPDFQRVAIRLPFVDRLNDGYSSFKYTPPILLSANPAAIQGFAVYAVVIPGTFEPPCNAYASKGPGATGSTAYVGLLNSTSGSKPAFYTSFTTKGGNPYSIEVFKNVTNQPFFGSNGPLCDNFITLFNTSLTTGVNAPVSVQGNVTVTQPFYVINTTFTNVWGYRMDNAFVEHILQPCDSLKGYTAKGSGD